MSDGHQIAGTRPRGHIKLSTGSASGCACVVCRSSSPRTNGPRVLTALAPYPDESLIGLVARVCEQNHVERVRTILLESTSTWHVHYNLAFRDDIDFDQLAFACRLAPHEVERRRYETIALRKSLPGVKFHGATIPAYDVDLRARRTCPSWARMGYHSALAHHKLITHCPDSGELLIDECPQCTTRFTWTKANLVSCLRCGVDLRTYHGVVLSRRIRSASGLLLNLIHPDRARQARALARLHASLRNYDRGTVFELGWRMGCAFSGYSLGERQQADRLPIEARLKILAAGSEALTNWPKSVTDGLSGRVVDTDKPSLDLASNVRRIASAQNTWPSLRDVMLEAAPDLRASSKSAVKSTLAKGANLGELQSELGIGQRAMERMLGSGEVKPVLMSGVVRSHGIYDASALSQLSEQLNDRITLGSVSQRLAVSRHGVEQLASLGLIEIYSDGAVHEGYMQRQVRRSLYYQLLERLTASKASILKASSLRREIGRKDRKAFVPIHALMRAIGGREKSWGPIILAMLAGDLEFDLDDRADEPFMKRVRVLAADRGKLLALRFRESDFPAVKFEASINGRDTEELLNIYPKAMQAAKRAKLLEPGEDGLYDRRKIHRLSRRYISTAEILARCNPGTRELPAQLKGVCRLADASPLGWIRDRVEAYF